MVVPAHLVRGALNRLKGIPYRFVPIPHNFIAFWMWRLSKAEIVVYQYICSRTLGFRRPADAIAVSQISRGIRSNEGYQLDQGTAYSPATVHRTLDRLERRGLLRRIKQKGRPTIFEPLAPLPLNSGPALVPNLSHLDE